MKGFSFIFAATFAFTMTTAYEFWISFESGLFSNHVKFTPHYPQCTKELNVAKKWDWHDDVSGNKRGVRSDGTDDTDPDVLEFNTGEDFLGHHTIYKDRGYKMVNVNDQQTGQCELDTSHAVTCFYGTGDLQTDQSIFRCTSDSVKLPS